MNTDPDYLRLVELVSALKADSPKIELHLLQGMSGNIVEGVRTGKMDAGFVFWLAAPPDVLMRPLRRVALKIVSPTCWAERVAEDPMIQALYRAVCKVWSVGEEEAAREEALLRA
jgi:DNA-binding transcriptional LysR family regulator